MLPLLSGHLRQWVPSILCSGSETEPSQCVSATLRLFAFLALDSDWLVRPNVVPSSRYFVGAES